MDHPFVSLPGIKNFLLKDSKVGFFIDVSASTEKIFADGYTFIEIFKRFYLLISLHLVKKSKIMIWDNNATWVEDEKQIVSNPTGGTNPQCIFDADTSAMADLDTVIILTDGEIKSDYVTAFRLSMIKYAQHIKTVIGVIVGRRGHRKPSDINVSVLIPAMVSNSCIIFHNTKNNYVMWATGTCNTAWQPIKINFNTSWDSITCIKIDDILSLIQVVHCDINLNKLIKQKYLAFGNGLFFNAEFFLKCEPTMEEFLNLPFNLICLYFRICKESHRLLSWFVVQKKRFFVESISNVNYICNRNNTLAWQYTNDVKISQIADSRFVPIILFFRDIEEAMVEDEPYTASSINKYTIHGMDWTSDDSMFNDHNFSWARFSEVYKWVFYFEKVYPEHGTPKIECTICGEEDVPCILIRKKICYDELLTYDFFYPKIVCVKCGDYFCLQKKDPQHVACIATLPLINLNDKTKEVYIEAFRHITDFKYDQRASLLFTIGIFMQCIQETFKNDIITNIIKGSVLYKN